MSRRLPRRLIVAAAIMLAAPAAFGDDASQSAVQGAAGDLAPAPVVMAETNFDPLYLDMRSTADDLVARVGAQMAELVSAAGEPAQDLWTSDTGLPSELATFIASASAASGRLHAEGGPADLACIYNGISHDLLRRLTAVADAGDATTQLRELGDLQTLLVDAVLVTPEIDELELAEVAGAPAMTCPASPIDTAQLAYFTVQP